MSKALRKRLEAVKVDMSPKMVEFIMEICGVETTRYFIPWDKSMGRYDGEDQVIELG